MSHLTSQSSRSCAVPASWKRLLTVTFLLIGWLVLANHCLLTASVLEERSGCCLAAGGDAPTPLENTRECCFSLKVLSEQGHHWQATVVEGERLPDALALVAGEQTRLDLPCRVATFPPRWGTMLLETILQRTLPANAPPVCA